MNQDNDDDDETYISPKISDRNWTEYRRLVLSELQRVERNINELNKRIDAGGSRREDLIAQLQVEVAMLKVKSSLWGALSGGFAAFLVIVLQFFRTP